MQVPLYETEVMVHAPKKEPELCHFQLRKIGPFACHCIDPTFSFQFDKIKWPILSQEHAFLGGASVYIRSRFSVSVRSFVFKCMHHSAGEYDTLWCCGQPSTSYRWLIKPFAHLRVFSLYFVLISVCGKL